MKLLRSGVYLALAGIAATATAANASVTININQVGSDVVATGSGSLDLTGLTDQGVFGFSDDIHPSVAYIGLGAAGEMEGYSGFTGPDAFGSGGATHYSSASGTTFALRGSGFFAPPGYVFVPLGYTGGSPIGSTATWLGQSIASLGLTSGTYVYSSAIDSVTVNVGPGSGAVPEPGTWVMMLLGFGAVGWTVRRKRRAAGSPQVA